MTTLTTIPVELAERSYRIGIGRGWIEEIGSTLKELTPGHRFAIVTNPEIGALWAERIVQSMKSAGLDAAVLTIAEGEEAKTLETVSAIYDFLIEGRYGRQTTLIALGGGVVGDVAGFAAASFLRGVALVQIPTSLLAMVDSSIGGKTGVNHRLGKNLIGAFKQPVFVGIDLDFLSTLPEAELRSGLAEVVKYGMIADAGLFGFLEDHVGDLTQAGSEAFSHLIARCCEIKAAVVAEDEEEHGRRAILNFGHTFAHAVENLTGYRKVRHGEAVAMGMVAACRLGSMIGPFPPEQTDRLQALLQSLGLATSLPRMEPERYLEAMRSDKKIRSGRLRFVTPVEIGRVEVRDDIGESIVIDALEASFQ